MTLIDVLKMTAALVAAITIGNWFLSEVRQTRIKGGPWYKAYLSVPGILILIFLAIPIVVWAVRS